MNSKKMFFVMIGVTVLMGGLVIAAVVLGDAMLHKQSSKLVSLKLDNNVIESQQGALVQAKKDVEKYSDLEAIAKQVVPQDKDQARATLEIINLAKQANVGIDSISFPPSTLGQSQAPATGAGSTQTKTTAPAAPAVTQVKAVDGLKGVYQYDIQVSSDDANPITYAKLIDFLSKLEQNRRTSQVSSMAIHPDAKDRSKLNFDLTITVFIKP
jgi:hypothetical protein